MRTIKTASEVFRTVPDIRGEGKSVGFVPTMGGLHEGHLSLIRRAREENDVVVVSIFVNPKQFGPNEDLDSYPRSIGKDSQLLMQEKVDILFYPNEEEMYPPGVKNNILELPYFCTPGDGTSRPGFFPGIAEAVSRLFQIIPAHKSYFGQKDYQQSLLAQWLTKVFHFDMEIVVCPIEREDDGLAISSRNWYLSDEERKKAPVLSQALGKIEELVGQGERKVTVLKDVLKSTIEEAAPLIRFDYAEVRERGTMKEVDEVEKGGGVVLVAAYAGKARLIDNVLI